MNRASIGMAFLVLCSLTMFVVAAEAGNADEELMVPAGLRMADAPYTPDERFHGIWFYREAIKEADFPPETARKLDALFESAGKELLPLVRGKNDQADGKDGSVEKASAIRNDLARRVHGLLTPQQRQTLKYRTGIVLINVLIAICPDAALEDDAFGPDPANLHLSRFQKLAIKRACAKAEDEQERLYEQFNKAVEKDPRAARDWQWQEKLREACFEPRRRARALMSPVQRERCDNWMMNEMTKAEREEATTRPGELGN